MEGWTIAYFAVAIMVIVAIMVKVLTALSEYIHSTDLFASNNNSVMRYILWYKPISSDDIYYYYNNSVILQKKSSELQVGTTRNI